jgi:hypothetical protein
VTRAYRGTNTARTSVNSGDGGGLGRSRHPIKELEALLREAEERRWRVDRGKGYYKLYCSCPERHKKTVKLTPSNPNYERECRNQLRRMTCWGGG